MFINKNELLMYITLILNKMQIKPVNSQEFLIKN